jgi:hypothetical protein
MPRLGVRRQFNLSFSEMGQQEKGQPGTGQQQRAQRGKAAPGNDRIMEDWRPCIAFRIILSRHDSVCFVLL